MPIQQSPQPLQLLPIALGRLWIQSESTPGRLFDIKASLTENVRDEEKGGEKTTTAL